MTAESTHAGEQERVLAWVVQYAARLGDAGLAPLRRIRVSTGTLALDVEWSAEDPGACAVAGGLEPRARERSSDEADQADTILITAPMVGTFYRAHEPGAPPFVEVGDLVEPGQQVGIIEAMKLMNAIQAEQRGRVSQIVAADGSPVQYEEPLLALTPRDGH